MRAVSLGILRTSIRMSSTLSYPQARRSGHIDVYKSEQKGSVSVPDPYNWLETYSAETESWIDEQVKLSRTYLDGIPYRNALEKEIETSMDYEKVITP